MKLATSRTALVGSLVATISAFLAFDPTRRAQLFYEEFLKYWPWLVLILAVVGVLQFIEDRSPLIITALLVAMFAVGQWGWPSFGWQESAQAAPWLGMLLGTALVIRSAVGTSHWYVCALLPRRLRVGRATLPPRTDLFCVAKRRPFRHSVSFRDK